MNFLIQNRENSIALAYLQCEDTISIIANPSLKL